MCLLVIAKLGRMAIYLGVFGFVLLVLLYWKLVNSLYLQQQGKEKLKDDLYRT